MTIAVTGTSGSLGRTTVETLLRTIDPRELVVTTRRPEALADLVAQGVEVRKADFTDPDTLTSAFVGVERLLLVSTDTVGARLDSQRAAVAAAASAGVRHVVYTSVPEPVPGNPALVVADHAGTEQAIRDSGMRWTVLRNNLYTHMQVAGIQHAAASGRFVSNAGDGVTAYVTRQDCAAAAAAVLTQDGHESKAYDITGPEAVSAADLAASARAMSTREVELLIVDDRAYAEGLRAAGLPDQLAELLTSFGAATRHGYLANVSSAVADLTGHTPTSLSQVLSAARKG